MAKIYTVYVLLFIVLVAKGAPQDDLINNLPGLSFLPNFKQYSGFLNVAPGKHFHYW